MEALTLCPKCGSTNAPANNFCGACAHPLRAGGPDEHLPAMQPVHVDVQPPSDSHAERRQLSVMFCDLIGSTELSHMMDPEDYRDIVQQYQDVCVRSIVRFGGYVAQYLGDGILAYFGYPVAHEDTAERSVRAGLAVLESIRRLDEALRAERDVGVAVRIGIETGLVVVGEVGSGPRREQLAVGDAPNLAARIQSLAPKNGLLVGGATHRLVRQVFETEDLGHHNLKGIDGGARLFRVVQERLDLGPLDVVGMREPAAALGRSREMEKLHRIWRGASTHGGSVLVIEGEAGIGKTHLLRALRQQLGPDNHHALQMRCSPYHAVSPYFPFVDLLHRMLNFYPQQPAAERRAMLEFVLERNDVTRPEAITQLAALLGIPSDDGEREETASSVRREQLEETLIDLLAGMAQDLPLLLIIEDVHWMDPSTRALLVRFALHINKYPMLLVLTLRPPLSLNWPPDAPVDVIRLDRLPRRDAMAMVELVAGQPAMPSSLLRQIIEKTDGVPLFIRELTRMVIESGRHAEARDGRDTLAIPATLHDSLMARLDQLMPVKEVAQLCSVFGREFSYRAVLATAEIPEAVLRDALSRLVEADLLVTDGAPPRNTYAFRHALIQEAAYESLLRSTRQLYHRRIAAFLVAQPEAAWEADIIAHHYTCGRQYDEAARFWYIAGQRAQARSANEEAEQHFRSGLKVLDDVPVTSARANQRLLLQVGIGGALLQMKGYSHAEVRRAFEAAHAASERVEDAAAVLPVLRGLLSHNLVMGRHEVSGRIAQRILSIAEQSDDTRHRVEGWHVAGTAALWRGDIALARGLLLKALRELPPKNLIPQPQLFEHPAVSIHAYLAIASWYRGEAETAVHHADAAHSIARTTGHPYSLIYALGFNLLIGSYLHWIQRTSAWAEEAIDIGSAHGFTFWTNAARIIHAWSGAGSDPQQAIVGMQEGIRAMEQQGVGLWLAHPRALLVDLYRREGRKDEARALAAQALIRSTESGELFYAPELFRLNAEIMASEDPERAMTLAEDGLKLAHSQGAVPLALRTLLTMRKLPYGAARARELHEIFRQSVGRISRETLLPEVEEAHVVVAAGPTSHDADAVRFA